MQSRPRDEDRTNRKFLDGPVGVSSFGLGGIVGPPPVMMRNCSELKSLPCGLISTTRLSDLSVDSNRLASPGAEGAEDLVRLP